MASFFVSELPRYTSQGISFEEHDRRQKAQQDAILAMENEIETMLQSAFETRTLLKKVFYFLSTSYFCQTVKGDIYPAELAIVQFSLNDGIMDSLHIYINPGKLPSGYFFEAQQLSDNTHKLKVPPNARGMSDYREICNKIQDFVKDEKILFTNHNEANETRLTFSKICGEAGAEEFKIYLLENLLAKFKRFVFMYAGIDLAQVKSWADNKLIARHMIDKDPEAYSLGLGCKVSFETLSKLFLYQISIFVLFFFQQFHDDEDRQFHCGESYYVMSIENFE